MRIGLMIMTGDGAIETTLDRIAAAERDGFASAWLPQIFGPDALTVLALAGAHTSRIELGTAVVPTYTRHPHSLAQQAATVNVAVGGRLALGVGRSHKLVIEGMFGLPYERALTHMREYLTVLRQLVHEGACSLDGKMYRVNASLSVPGGKPFPVLAGALMPRMLEICGELCDGTLTWMSGPRHLASGVVPTITAAAKAAGRPAPRVICSLPVCVTDDGAAAREVAAKAFSVYRNLPVYRACLDAEGADGPADIAIVGNEDEVRRALGRVSEAGATDFYAAIFPEGDKEKSLARSYALLKSFGGAL